MENNCEYLVDLSRATANRRQRRLRLASAQVRAHRYLAFREALDGICRQALQVENTHKHLRPH